MNLLAWIIVGASFYGGWVAHKRKDQLKKWIKARLRKANESASRL